MSDTPIPPDFVARLKQPIPLGAFARLADALTVAYGPDLTMEPDGDWIIIRTPTRRDAEPDHG